MTAIDDDRRLAFFTPGYLRDQNADVTIACAATPCCGFSVVRGWEHLLERMPADAPLWYVRMRCPGCGRNERRFTMHVRNTSGMGGPAGQAVSGMRRAIAVATEP